MKTKILAGLFLVALLVAGCVDTVSGRKTAGVPWVKDKVIGQYERPVEVVYNASRDVLKFNGSLLNETTLHNDTNTVKTVEALVNQRRVWVRVYPVDTKVTAVAVQARSKAGGVDVDLAPEIEKQIALKMVSR
jgi:hypothetical protein